MTDNTITAAASSADIRWGSDLLAQLRTVMNKALLGQPAIVDQVLIALLANGHVLIEGVPGLGKTLLVRTLAMCFAGDYKRIQFTPDLMPADITGHVLFDMKESQFRMRRGPVFTNLLLADEINRAPAKTQAALLEVMQERQVTLEGRPHALALPFMVLATQNPIEQEGTYPLPEAELDRFLMKMHIDYPAFDDELQLIKTITTGRSDDNASLPVNSAVLSVENIQRLQQIASQIMADDQVIDYALRLVRATRESSLLLRGAGTRAALALVRCARANALLRGDDFVLPDDVKLLALPVMRHRVTLSPAVEIGLNVDQALLRIIDSVSAPRL